MNKEFFPMQRKISILERELEDVEASRKDPVRYVELCDELGIEPCYSEFYQQGLAEILFSEQFYRETNTKKRTGDLKYERFYREGNRLNSSFEEDILEKRRLLETYFPGRFGKQGKQPVSKIEDSKAGSLFDKLLKYSENRIKKNQSVGSIA